MIVLFLHFLIDLVVSSIKGSYCGPMFLHDAFPLNGKLALPLVKMRFFEKDLESLLIWSGTPYLEKTAYGKAKSGSGVRLLIGKVR